MGAPASPHSRDLEATRRIALKQCLQKKKSVRRSYSIFSGELVEGKITLDRPSVPQPWVLVCSHAMRGA